MPPASIADVWFTHQRGFRTSLLNLGYIGGINLASPIAGTLIQNYGVGVCWYGMGGAFILQFILIYFFMPETAYVRSARHNIDFGSGKALNSDDSMKAQGDHVSSADILAPTSTNTMSEPVNSFWRQMLPYSGYDSGDNFFWICARPIRMAASPAVLWASILYMTAISWLVLIAVTISQIFSAPPYSFGIKQVGLVNLSSFVASILATLLADPLTDGVGRYMARRNGGIYGKLQRLSI